MAGMRFREFHCGARYPLYAATGAGDGLVIVLSAELTLFRSSGATRRDAARASNREWAKVGPRISTKRVAVGALKALYSSRAAAAAIRQAQRVSGKKR
jgi:hypothetical protein